MTIISDSKHRFLFASVDAPPRTGGVANLAYNLSKQLTKSYGSEAVFIGPAGTHFSGLDANFKVLEDHNSDTRLRDGSGSDREDDRIEDLFYRVIESYNLDQLFLLHPFYYALGGIKAARRHDIASNLYLHGTELTSQFPQLVDSSEPDLDFAGLDPTGLPFRLGQAIQMVDRIYTNSHFSKSLISKMFPEKSIVVSGCGIDARTLELELKRSPKYDELQKALLREKLGLNERLTLVTVARLVPHKNVSSIIEFLPSLPEGQLVIIGDGPQKAELSSLAERLSVSDRVIFLGSVNEDMKWAYLRAADVGVLASSYDGLSGGYEGFGIVMLEYAAAGCIVLSSGKHGMYDFVGRYKCGILGLTDGSDFSKTAARITTLMADPDAVNNLVTHSRTVISERFTWNKVADIVRASMVSK